MLMTTALDEMWMISVDDHLIEPPSVWVDRLPAKFRDRGPRWVTDDQGEAWHIEDDTRVVVNGAVVSAAYSAAERPGPYQPMAWSEIPPSCYDPFARAEAMDMDHVFASLPFPNLPGFAGRVFQNLEDKDLALSLYSGLQRLDHRRVRRGNPRTDHRGGAHSDVGRQACRTRGGASDWTRCVFSFVQHGAAQSRFPADPRRALGSSVLGDERGWPAYLDPLGTGFETDPGLMVQKLHSKPK